MVSVLFPVEIEFKRDTRVVFRCGGRHFDQPVDVLKFCFHGFDKQCFTVFGRNPGEGDGHEDDRNFNIGLAFFGQAGIRRTADHKGQKNKGDTHART